MITREKCHKPLFVNRTNAHGIVFPTKGSSSRMPPLTQCHSVVISRLKNVINSRQQLNRSSTLIHTRLPDLKILLTTRCYQKRAKPPHAYEDEVQVFTIIFNCPLEPSDLVKCQLPAMGKMR